MNKKLMLAILLLNFTFAVNVYGTENSKDCVTGYACSLESIIKPQESNVGAEQIDDEQNKKKDKWVKQ